VYKSVLYKKLRTLDDLNVIETGDQSTAQAVTDRYRRAINNIINSLISEAGCVPSKMLIFIVSSGGIAVKHPALGANGYRFKPRKRSKLFQILIPAITIVRTTVPWLQRSIVDRFPEYALKLRFKYGKKKTKCIVISDKCLNVDPVWYLIGKQTESVKILEILSVIFEEDSSGSQTSSVEKRMGKCRSFYGFRDIGMSYPALSSDVKTYI